jgi:hypothetical protein
MAINEIIPYLPDTIESCTATNIGYTQMSIMIQYVKSKNCIQSFDMQSHNLRVVQI